MCLLIVLIYQVVPNTIQIFLFTRILSVVVFDLYTNSLLRSGFASKGILDSVSLHLAIPDGMLLFVFFFKLRS